MASEVKQIPEFNIMMWPGYQLSIAQVNDGIFVNIDTATKFVQMPSVLDEIRDLEKQRFSKKEIMASIAPNEGRKLVVITMYNSRTY